MVNAPQTLVKGSYKAEMGELAYPDDLKSSAERLAGSSPALGMGPIGFDVAETVRNHSGWQPTAKKDKCEQHGRIRDVPRYHPRLGDGGGRSPGLSKPAPIA